MNARHPRRGVAGQAALSMVFVVGTIAVIAGLSMAFLAISFLNSSVGFRSAQQATAAAMAGVHDSLLRLARNQAANSATFTVNGVTVGVSTTLDSATGIATIISTASVGSYERQIRATASVATTSWEVNLTSWQLQ